MGTGYIESQVQRVNRNLLLVNGSVLGLIVLFIAFMIAGGAIVARDLQRGQDRMNAAGQDATAIYHQSAGLDLAHPTQISAADVTSLDRLKQLEGHAVTLTDPHAQNLRFPVWDFMRRASGKDKPHTPPFYHVVGTPQSHPFLILPRSPHPGKAFTGVIRSLAREDEGATHPVLMAHGFVQAPTPFVLDCLSLEGSPVDPAEAFARSAMQQAAEAREATKADVQQHVWFIGSTPLLVFGLVIGLCGWNVSKAIFRIKNPRTHPIYAKLGWYGSPIEISRAINGERQVGVVGIARAEFTYSWLLFPSLFTLDVVPLDEIAWAYQMVTLYNFIPVSTRMVLYDRAGRNHPISAASEQIVQILAYIRQVRPWVALGYNGQLRNRFFSDRAAVLAEIDARRAGSAAQRPI